MNVLQQNRLLTKHDAVNSSSVRLYFCLMLLFSDHNRIHAADVLHAVFYITTQPIPGFMQVTVDEEHPLSHRSTTSAQGL